MIRLTENFFKNQERSFFIYDPAVIKNNIEKIKGIYPLTNRLFYSVKANPNPKLIEILSHFGMHFDVSSESELNLVSSLKVPSQSITLSGPAKTRAALKLAERLGIYSVHLDSFEEYIEIKKTPLAFSLRLPLDDAFSKKLGLPYRQVHEILSSSQGRVKGFHIYVGRERASKALAEKYKIEIESLILKYTEAFSGKPEVFWGSGLPPALFLNKQDEVSVPHSNLFVTHLEAGRTFIHDGGWYGAKVLAKKIRANGPLVIIDGGLQNVATYFSSPKFGQEGLRVLFFNSSGDALMSKNGILSDVYGSLGIWNDLMIRKIEIPHQLQRNDWMVINPAGAYGWTASTNQFIGPQFCDEYILENNKFVKVSPKASISYLESGVYENSAT